MGGGTSVSPRQEKRGDAEQVSGTINGIWFLPRMALTSCKLLIGNDEALLRYQACLD
jgi:hypothetical protein